MCSDSSLAQDQLNVEDPQEVPDHLELKADRQFHDRRRSVTIVEGNVSIRLGDAELHADRIEFDGTFKTLFARGSVRFRRGRQFFQASALRYNLVQNEGELDDVYGVIDLESLDRDFQVGSPADQSPSESDVQSLSRDGVPAVAAPCP